MLNNLKNKVITVHVGSNSGASVSNGTHGTRTSVSSTIIITGVLVDCNDKFLHLKNTETFTLSQLGVDMGFNDKNKLSTLASGDTIIALDKVLFINF